MHAKIVGLEWASRVLAATSAVALLLVLWTANDGGQHKSLLGSVHAKQTGTVEQWQQQVMSAHPWMPPAEGDERSPCPALNTLANHGFIARSGREITVDQLVEAMEKVYRLSPSIGRFLANGGSKNTGIIQLSALQEHGFIEHDVSLVHEDTAIGNNTLVSDRLVEQIVEKAATAPGGRMTLAGLAAFRAARYQDSLAKNSKGLTFGLREKAIASGEAALLWAAMAKQHGALLPETLKAWLGQEQLPEDYVPRTGTIGLAEIAYLATSLGFKS
jgi:hypothetical protein